MEKITRKSVLTKVKGFEGLNDEERAVIDKMIASLDKRSANKSGKPTKRQTENEDVKVRIHEFLDANEQATATEIGNAVDVSCQRASALLKQMEVPKTKIKGKMYYGWAVAETAEENEDNA